MNQKPTVCFESKCGRARTFVDNDMELGHFHDYLMFLKGSMVEKMVEAQKEEQAFSEAQKTAEIPAVDSCSEPE